MSALRRGVLLTYLPQAGVHCIRVCPTLGHIADACPTLGRNMDVFAPYENIAP